MPAINSMGQKKPETKCGWLKMGLDKHSPFDRYSISFQNEAATCEIILHTLRNCWGRLGDFQYLCFWKQIN